MKIEFNDNIILGEWEKSLDRTKNRYHKHNIAPGFHIPDYIYIDIYLKDNRCDIYFGGKLKFLQEHFVMIGEQLIGCSEKDILNEFDQILLRISKIQLFI